MDREAVRLSFSFSFSLSLLATSFPLLTLVHPPSPTHHLVRLDNRYHRLGFEPALFNWNNHYGPR